MSTPNIAPLLSGQVIGSTSDSFVIAEWRDAGGPAGPPRLIAPLHLHRQDDEAWYVLEGALRLQVGKEEVEARAGSAVFVPSGARSAQTVIAFLWNGMLERKELVEEDRPL